MCFVVLDLGYILMKHVRKDLPILARYYYSNNASAIDLESRMEGHVDIPRLRAGMVGGFFWFVPLIVTSCSYIAPPLPVGRSIHLVLRGSPTTKIS